MGSNVFFFFLAEGFAGRIDKDLFCSRLLLENSTGLERFEEPWPFFKGVIVAVGVMLNLIRLLLAYGSALVRVTDGVRFVDLEIFCREIVGVEEDIVFEALVFPVAGVNVQDPMVRLIVAVSPLGSGLGTG